jgi:hypothetical protein
MGSVCGRLTVTGTQQADSPHLLRPHYPRVVIWIILGLLGVSLVLLVLGAVANASRSPRRSAVTERGTTSGGTLTAPADVPTRVESTSPASRLALVANISGVIGTVVSIVALFFGR